MRNNGMENLGYLLGSESEQRNSTREWTIESIMLYMFIMFWG